MDTNEIPLLDLDLNTIETKLPVVKPGIYECRIAKSEVVKADDPSKADAWKLTIETTGPTVSVDDKPVDPGHPFFLQTQLRPTGKATMKMVAQNIGQIVQGLRPRIDGKLSLPIDPWHKQAEGRMVRVRVNALPARENPKVPGQMFRATNQVDEVFAN